MANSGMILVHGQVFQRGRFDPVKLPGGVDRAGLYHPPDAFLRGRLEHVKGALPVDAENFLRAPMRWAWQRRQVHHRVAAADRLAQLGKIVDIARLVFRALKGHVCPPPNNPYRVALFYQPLDDRLAYRSRAAGDQYLHTCLR